MLEWPWIRLNPRPSRLQRTEQKILILLWINPVGFKIIWSKCSGLARAWTIIPNPPAHSQSQTSAQPIPDLPVCQLQPMLWLSLCDYVASMIATHSACLTVGIRNQNVICVLCSPEPAPSVAHWLIQGEWFLFFKSFNYAGESTRARTGGYCCTPSWHAASHTHMHAAYPPDTHHFSDTTASYVPAISHLRSADLESGGLRPAPAGGQSWCWPQIGRAESDLQHAVPRHLLTTASSRMHANICSENRRLHVTARGKRKWNLGGGVVVVDF